MKITNHLKALKLFVDHKDKAFTIRKAAESLKLNYRIAYEEIIKLEQEGSLKIVRYGKSKVCTFNYRYRSNIAKIEEIRKQEILKNKDLKLVYDRISEVRNPFYCLILFGSFANQTNKKGSDIDLCLVTDNEEINKKVQSMLRITPLPVHLVDFTSEEFLAMLRSREQNVGNEIIKNNIIFHGLEIFYEMVNYVKQ